MVNRTNRGYRTHKVHKMYTPMIHELENIREYKNPLTDTSKEHKRRLEDKRSGYITTEELRNELAILKSKDNEN